LIREILSLSKKSFHFVTQHYQEHGETNVKSLNAHLIPIWTTLART